MRCVSMPQYVRTPFINGDVLQIFLYRSIYHHGVTWVSAYCNKQAVVIFFFDLLIAAFFIFVDDARDTSRKWYDPFFIPFSKYFNGLIAHIQVRFLKMDKLR